MQTIMQLEKQLELAKATRNESQVAFFSTGIVIDLLAPEGNVFAIMGLCQSLFCQFGMPEEITKYHNECRNGYYKDVLEISRRWFSFIYLNEQTSQ
jgi:hypothetical protein